MENTNNTPPEPLSSAINSTQVQPVPPPEFSASNLAPTATPPQSSPKKKKTWPIFVSLLIVILITSGIAIVLLKNDSKPKSVTVIKDIPLLREGSLAGPIGADYLFPNAEGTQASHEINLQVFEGLVSYRNQKIVPALSTSWTNPNKSTWVFKIAQDVKFQDGSTMTAADVARSINADIANDDWNVYLTSVKSAEVTGSNEVTIVTTNPDSLLLDKLVYVFIFKQSSDVTYGTGPYTIDKTKTLDENNLALKAFENYHGGSPKTKAVTYKVYDDADQLTAAFKAGKIDVFNTRQNNTTVTTLGSTAKHITTQEPGSFGLFSNMTRPNATLANPKLRQAIAYAIDRPALIKQLDESLSPAYGIVPKTAIGYDSAATFPNTDVTRAKQLQTEAGYPNGAPITFLYIKDVQPEPPILIAQLRAAGFQVNEVAEPTPKDMISRIKTGNYDMFGISYFSNYNDATDIFINMLDSRNSDFGVYDNPAFDALIDASEQAFDPAEHIQKVQAINKFIASNYLWIPVRTADDTLYARSKYTILPYFMSAPATTQYWLVGQPVTTTLDK